MMINQRIGCVLFVCCAGIVWLGSHAVAQQAYPMLMSVDPVAAQIGQVSQHTIKSRYSMAGAYRVLVSGTGVTGEIVPPAEGSEPPKTPLQALQVRFVVAENALPGVRDVRLATPQGVSTVAQLVIGHDPVVPETADNNRLDVATPFTIPATLCGSLEKAEDVDFYRFSARSGQSVCFRVRCMNLQDRIHDLQSHADPILTLRGATGSTVIASDNVFGADPFFCYTFAEDGEYFLELRDVRYQGNEHWKYSVEVSTRPHVQAVFPLAVSAAPAIVSVTPLGAGMSADATANLHVPEGATAAADVQFARLSLEGQPDGAIPVVIDGGPFVSETADPNDTPDVAQAITLPNGIHGRIDRAADVDCYAFEAKRGDAFTFEVFAKRVGSSLDSHLRLLDASGKQLQLNDDLRDGKRTFSDSRIESWSVPADGRYVVEVRDLNLRGGSEFVYFLKAAASQPHFKLYTDTDKTLLTPGTSGVIFVRADRKHGFAGEIELQASGLPPGVTATGGRILAGSHIDGCIVLTADAAATPDVANIEIRGVANPMDASGQPQELVATATVYQEIYQPGGGRGHWPVAGHAVSVGAPADILAVRVTPQDIRLKPGESITLDIEVERAAGFDKNVLLEVFYQHLNSVFGDALPKGVTVDASASNTLLTGGATQGKITLKAAADAVPTERQIFAVMANVSINFVMKATYASPPMQITIAP